MKNKVTTSTQGKRWSWSKYLEEQNAEAAPLNLFTQYQAFLGTSASNGFQVGMRLEGIDPLHPAMFCVLSVAEVIGYRLRLHIDGYSECYDFWANADSPDIRPAGWCKRHKHRLHPPKGHSETGFDWDKYLQSTNSQAAPDSLFSSQTVSTSATCQFEVGMRLEAVDRKNPFLVCVASIGDVIAQRFLVHFDNWDDTYDYWCDSSSPYIHPVGWCEENKRPLTAPQGHPRPESFLWSEYLEENNWTAVPRSAFTVRAPHGFCVDQKLEAVDRRNPMLIRVATVTETDEYRVKIHYDGWSDRFDLWCDSELSDLHPVGWCQQTGHPLEPPPGPSPIPSCQGACPTPGCRGVGHVRGAKYTGHHSAFGCPYSDMNLRKEVALPDRLGVDKIITLVPITPIPHDTHRLREEEEVRQDTPPVRERLVLTLGKRPRHADSSHPTKYCRIKIKEEEKELPVKASVPGDSSIHQSIFQSRELPLCWEQHSKLMPSLSHLEPSTVQHWSIEQVSEFVQSLPGCEDQASLFREEQIDGRAFLLLTQQDIVRILSIKLGPALKIYNSILMFRHAESKPKVSRGVDP